ncbi:MAG: dihydroorotate dehydrogenase electron transfer subunit [Clostridia bacterium]|nr:MAG: dihydroorotate dehydrogenase electron transfer subunit [Clostridia bacterium]
MRTSPHPITDARCTVISNEAAHERYRHLVVQAPAPMLEVRPGQFFNLLCPPADTLTPFLRRPLSVYLREPSQGRLHFLYKIAGKGTQALARLQPGATLDIFGPLGRGFWLQPTWRTLLVVARGVGLATLAALAQAAHEQGRRVVAVCSARSPQDAVGLDAFRQVAEVYEISDSMGTAAMPAVETLLRHIIDKQNVDALFTCGSNRLLRLMQQLGSAYNLPGQVALEAHMACGLGLCHGCVRPFMHNGRQVYRRVCTEGPVFDLQEAIAWKI